MTHAPKIKTPVVVASRTFSNHAILRDRMKERFERVVFNDQGLTLKDAALVSFLKGHAGAIIALEKITEEALAQLPELKVISKFGVGLDNLDQDAMQRRGLRLGWTGGVNRRSVSELALFFALGMLRGSLTGIRNVAAGKWAYPGGRTLEGKTVGIVGAGFVGADLCRLLAPFRVSLLIHDLLVKPELGAETGARQVSKDEILANSDVLSLHLPFEPSTRHWLDAAGFGMMKRSSCLVNTSRGGVVDEAALIASLRDKRIAAAASDVLEQEPPAVDYALLALPEFFGTPHIGGNSAEAILAMGTAAIENLERELGNS